MSNPVIICAALTGAATFKQNNPSVPYTIEEFAVEAEKCFQAGAAMVHVHARTDDGDSTHEIDRSRPSMMPSKNVALNLSSACLPQ